jgi:hypothetical protein
MTGSEKPAVKRLRGAVNGRRRKRPVWPVVKTAAFILIFFLTILGTLLLATIFGADSLWPVIRNMAQPGAAFSFRLVARWAMIAAVIIVFLGTIRQDLKALVKDGRAFSVRLIGMLALLLGLSICALLATDFLSLKAINKSLPGDIYQTALALEMAQSPEEVSRIEQTVAETKDYAVVAGGQTAVEQSRRKLSGDVSLDFIFVVLYTLINLAFCYWLSQRTLKSPRLAQGLGIVAAVFALTAAAFDIRENLLLFRVLGGQPTIELIHQLSLATHIKWAAIFATLALLSLIFIRRQRLLMVIALLLWLAAAVGLYGLFSRAAIQWAFVLLGVSMVLIGWLMTFKPLSFLGGLTHTDKASPHVPLERRS